MTAPGPSACDWAGLADEQRTWLTQAARPTLFSATGRPDLIMALLLAHLMSPRLWDLAARATHAATLRAGGAAADPDAAMAALAHFVNQRFYHARKQDFGRIWGLQERALITDPAERATSDYAMSVLALSLIRRYLDTPTVDSLFPLLKEGVFPLYVYPTVEVIGALGHRLQGAPAKALGVTSCLDECVLIAALVVAAGIARLDDLILFGSPFHYSLFVFPGDRGFWVNAKREMFTAATWHAEYGHLTPAERESVFDQKMVMCDRVITARGYCLLPNGPATLTRDRLSTFDEHLRRFMGAPPGPFQVALAATRAAAVNRDACPWLEALASAHGAGEFEQRVLDLAAATGDPLLAAALYTHRHPCVRHPAAYCAAALKGYRVLLRSAEVAAVDDALAIAAGITGRDSVFGPSGRLALPDEALYLDTASPAERALLVYALLALSPAFSAADKATLDLAGTPRDWQVRFRGATVPPPA